MPDARPRMFWLRDLAVLVSVIAFAGMLISMWVRINQPRPNHGHCINNQGQVGKAVLSYTVRNGRFPGYQEGLNGKPIPWTAAFLTELGRGDLHDTMLQTSSPPPSRIDILRCPSDRAKRRQSDAPDLSYVINAGCAQDAGNVPANGVAMDRYGGQQEVTLAYVAQHDGTANTFLLSENLQAARWDNPGRIETAFLWHNTTTPYREHRINGGDIQAPVSIHTARPSSNHSGGAVFTFCDGHTSFIDETIDYKTYMQLMTPHGRESDMPPQWKEHMPTGTDY